MCVCVPVASGEVSYGLYGLLRADALGRVAKALSEVKTPYISYAVRPPPPLSCPCYVVASSLFLCVSVENYVGMECISCSVCGCHRVCCMHMCAVCVYLYQCVFVCLPLPPAPPQTYESLCGSAGIAPAEAKEVASRLHSAGILLWFPETPALANLILLRPQTVVEAVYARFGTASPRAAHAAEVVRD